MALGAQDATIGAIRGRWQRVTPGYWHITLGSGEHLMTAVMAEQGEKNTLIADTLPDWAIKGKYAASLDEQGANLTAIAHASEDMATLLAALDAAETRQMALVALAHELVALEHGARAEQLQALHRLGIVVTLGEHLARARAFADKQHARIDALAALGEGDA